MRTIGLVYSPSYVENLSFTVDFWTVKLEDNIGALGASNILATCYNTGVFCDRFERDSAGEVAFVNNRLANPGRLDSKGVDFSAKYALRDTPWGTFRFSFDSTYTARHDRTIIVVARIVDFDDFAGEFAESSSGGEGNFARWRSLANVTWNKDDWSANYTNQYIHHVDEQAKYSGGLIVSDTRPSCACRP